MCGIAGIFHLSAESATDTVALRRAVSRMDLRGPDDRGFFHAPGVALGHRRLAIIDLESGCQPLTDPESGQTIVFNGELFNFRDLRERLQTSGRVFHTKSDTEVLLKAYGQWGVDSLSRLNGMFAFAVFDPREQRLFLARDRAGVKPLFYAVEKDRLVFASSMAALLCLLEGVPRLDAAALAHYLTTVRTTLGRRTLIRDVQTLLPGEYLLVERRPDAPQPRRYWDIPALAPADKPARDMDEAVEEARSLLEDAVRLQLISDVPLGGFLSGGLDSVILAAIASRQTNGHYNAYSVGYDREGYNEWPHVREAAERYNMWCRQIHLRPGDYPHDWQFLVRQKGLPLSTPNEVPIYHLAKALREEFTVALSGEGADEIFGGYTIPYFSAHDYERAARQSPGSAGGHAAMISRLYGIDHLPDPVTHHFLLNSWMPEQARRELLVGSGSPGTGEMFAWYRDQYAAVAHCSPLDQRMHVHARVNLEGLLFRVDASSMAASVEARVPYTDHRLIELLFGLPDSFRIDFRDEAARVRGDALNVLEIEQAGLLESKRLLRLAFRDEVPESILTRPKMSFPVPVFDWLATDFAPLLPGLIGDCPWVGTLFEARAVERLLQQPMSKASAMALWPVLNLCLWQREFGIAL